MDGRHLSPQEIIDAVDQLKRSSNVFWVNDVLTECHTKLQLAFQQERSTNIGGTRRSPHEHDGPAGSSQLRSETAQSSNTDATESSDDLSHLADQDHQPSKRRRASFDDSGQQVLLLPPPASGSEPVPPFDQPINTASGADAPQPSPPDTAGANPTRRRRRKQERRHTWKPQELDELRQHLQRALDKRKEPSYASISRKMYIAKDKVRRKARELIKDMQAAVPGRNVAQQGSGAVATVGQQQPSQQAGQPSQQQAQRNQQQVQNLQLRLLPAAGLAQDHMNLAGPPVGSSHNLQQHLRFDSPDSSQQSPTAKAVAAAAAAASVAVAAAAAAAAAMDSVTPAAGSQARKGSLLPSFMGTLQNVVQCFNSGPSQQQQQEQQQLGHGDSAQGQVRAQPPGHMARAAFPGELGGDAAPGRGAAAHQQQQHQAPQSRSVRVAAAQPQQGQQEPSQSALSQPDKRKRRRCKKPQSTQDEVPQGGHQQQQQQGQQQQQPRAQHQPPPAPQHQHQLAAPPQQQSRPDTPLRVQVERILRQVPNMQGTVDEVVEELLLEERWQQVGRPTLRRRVSTLMSRGAGFESTTQWRSGTEKRFLYNLLA